MDSAPTPEPVKPSALQRILPYTTVLLVIALGYLGWTFYSRHQAEKDAQQAIEAKKHEREQTVVDQVFGNGEVSFTTFGADSGSLKRGETTQLCYGVVNATTVKLDPPVEQAKPTYHHCLEIAPKKTTTYTITASDAKGHTKTESVTVKVE